MDDAGVRPSPYRVPSPPPMAVPADSKAEDWAIGAAWAVAWLAGLAYLAMGLVHHEPFDAARSIAAALVVLGPMRLVATRS